VEAYRDLDLPSVEAKMPLPSYSACDIVYGLLPIIKFLRPLLLHCGHVIGVWVKHCHTVHSRRHSTCSSYVSCFMFSSLK